MSGSLTIVIPTYNEEGNIVDMSKCLRKMYPEFHILYMDDNSTDKTKELVEGLADPLTNIKVRNGPRGLAASVMQGFVECGTDYFVCMDCDFQHPPSAIKGIYESLETGADLCVGTRDDRKALGFVRWAGSWAFNILADSYLFFHGKKHTEDIMSGLFGGRCDVYVPVIKENWQELELTGWKVLIDLLKFGPKNVKISKYKYKFGKRQNGNSKISPMVVVTSFYQCGAFGHFGARIYSAIKSQDWKTYKEAKKNQGPYPFD